jgi:bla regulator protein blaR1
VASEFIAALARMNLAAAAAILAVLALRRPIRACFGARAAYALWLVVPLAALACLAPPRRIEGAAPESALTAFAAVSRFVSALDTQGLACLWLVGAIAALTALIWRQHRYIASLGALHSDREGLYRATRADAGPALVGALRPRIVAPADFDTRFDDDERTLILAHERTHLDAGDAQINALVALSSCLFWFNPLVHIAAFRLRLDQELACDADVVAAYPHERRRYAETLLKTQLGARAAPIGCAWPPRAAHPLRERVATLCEKAPSLRQPAAAMSMLAVLGIAVATMAWASQPPIYAPPHQASCRAEQYYVVAASGGAYAVVAAPEVVRDSPDLSIAVDRGARLHEIKQQLADDGARTAASPKAARYASYDPRALHD